MSTGAETLRNENMLLYSFNLTVTNLIYMKFCIVSRMTVYCKEAKTFLRYSRVIHIFICINNNYNSYF